MLHDWMTISFAALCLWAIVSPRVPTGIVPTIGLCIVASAALWSLDDMAPAQTVLDAMIGGLCVVGAGLLWRFYRRPKHQMRRRTDWGDLPPVRPEDLHRVAGRGR